MLHNIIVSYWQAHNVYVRSIDLLATQSQYRKTDRPTLYLNITQSRPKFKYIVIRIAINELRARIRTQLTH